MSIKIEEVIEEGKTILPACPIDGQVTGIYTDVQKIVAALIVTTMLYKKRMTDD